MTVPGASTSAKTGTPYDTAAPFIGNNLPGWVGSKFDKLRVASYDLYDSIYRNVTGTFQLIARGTENNPVYIPNGKTIVETCHRYLCVEFDYKIEGGTVTGRQAATDILDKVFRRNKFFSKFTTQKRYGLIRGDALWHIIAYPNMANPEKRIQIMELDPRTYFPITDPHNSDILLGCHIIQRLLDPADKSTRIVRRQTYLYNPDGTVQTSMNYYKETAWDDRVDPETLLPYQREVLPLTPANRDVLVQLTDAVTGEPLYNSDGSPMMGPGVENVRGEAPFDFTLDARITHLPVFHVKNMRAPNDPFGVSEMAGIERVIAGINQAISDEELTLALDGLGLYATTSGPPTDDNGTPIDWVLGPGRVVEIEDGSTFSRVSGATNIKASQDHLDWLTKSIRENTATSDVSIGIAINSREASGVALALQFAPLLAKNAEKESEMLPEYDLMFNSLLNEWLPVYGVFTPEEGLIVSPMVGDPMPIDRAAVLAEVTQLVAENIITILEAQSILKDKLGYEFKFSSMDDFMEQTKALSAARDPFGQRLDDEAAALQSGDAANEGVTAQPPTATPPAAPVQPNQKKAS